MTHKKSTGLRTKDTSLKIREKQVEQALVKETRQSGGMCPKLVSPGTDGMPDRLVLLPEGRMGFVEVKASGKKPRPLQQKRHEQLKDLGYTVAVLDDPQQIPEILDEIRR